MENQILFERSKPVILNKDEGDLSSDVDFHSSFSDSGDIGQPTTHLMQLESKI